jgi:hypothetical protein
LRSSGFLGPISAEIPAFPSVRPRSRTDAIAMEGKKSPMT